MNINTDEAPTDPLERLIWLSGVQAVVDRELRAEYEAAYFTLRLERRLEAAMALRLHSKKRILAMTRAENQRRGRQVRWGDGVDATSTAFTG